MEVITTYFPGLTPRQLEQFALLKRLYTDWNEKINVISRKDIENLYVHHVLHSLAIAKLITFKPGTKILDVGTGGGFPGIPLAIFFPEVEFHLIDSIGKKIKVTADIAEQLNLTNVRAQQIRAEKVKGQYPFIISRAVTNLSTFYQWVQHKISCEYLHALPNGILYLKGGDVKGEISSVPRECDIYNIHKYFNEPFFEEKKIIHVIC